MRLSGNLSFTIRSKYQAKTSADKHRHFFTQYIKSEIYEIYLDQLEIRLKGRGQKVNDGNFVKIVSVTIEIEITAAKSSPSHFIEIAGPVWQKN